MSTAQAAKAPHWSAKELEILRQVYPAHGARAVSQITRRPLQATTKRANGLGLKRVWSEQDTCEPARLWTARESQVIAARYLEDGPHVLAEEMGRTAMEVVQSARRMGFPSRTLERRRLPIGTVRIRSFGARKSEKIPCIRVAMTGNRSKDWKRLEVYEWELQHGPVPAGFVLMLPRGMARIASNCQLRRIEDVPVLAANVNASEEEAELNRFKAMLGSQLRRIEKANGIERPRLNNWQPTEIAFLRASYDQERQRLTEISIALGRSRRAVARMADSLGLTRMAFGAWTQAEDSLLVSRFKTTLLRDIAELLNRTPKAVERRAKKLGLSKKVRT